jgi:putative SOS response-associated peptidase YedK
MCSNYRPVTRMDRLLTFFGVEPKEEVLQRDAYPLGMAPFIRLTVEGQEGGKLALIAVDAMFGLLPRWATEMQFGRKAYNVRSETVATRAALRAAWKRGHPSLTCRQQGHRLSQHRQRHQFRATYSKSPTRVRRW